jgi:choline-sulfatase
VFRQYWVEGNESQTSHASVWTSLFPANHNVRTAGNGGTWQLARSFARLPVLLGEAGFHNIGVTANGYVTMKGGYGRGFDVFRNLMREGAAVNGNVPAAQILDLGLEYMATKYQDSPVFLFLGSIDTHKPWIGHEPWLSRYDPEPYSGIHQRAAWPRNLGMTQGSMKCVETPEPRDLARINAIYDSDVSYQDQQLGRLMDQLEAWGIADQTMIIVTADHGEELWEAGRCGHGASLRETLVWVPLLIHYPPLFHGRVVEQGADGVDLLPTILDALDLPEVDAAQGHSLIPLAQNTMTAMAGYPMPSYASQYEYAHAMRVANWKARVGRSGVPELYDLRSDPGELVNLAAERPIARQFMSDVLATFLIYRQRWKKRLWGVASNMSARAARDLEGQSHRQERRPAEDR